MVGAVAAEHHDGGASGFRGGGGARIMFGRTGDAARAFLSTPSTAVSCVSSASRCRLRVPLPEFEVPSALFAEGSGDTVVVSIETTRACFFGLGASSSNIDMNRSPARSSAANEASPPGPGGSAGIAGVQREDALWRVMMTPFNATEGERAENKSCTEPNRSCRLQPRVFLAATSWSSPPLSRAHGPHARLRPSRRGPRH